MMNMGSEALYRASHIDTSNWVFQEKRRTKWTAEENKKFENALAVYDKDTSDRWYKVAAMIPGKTVGDVIEQYKELEEDVSDIEAGLYPIPAHGSDSFRLEWGGSNELGFVVDGFGQNERDCGIGKRGSAAQRKKGLPWTQEEHRKFLMGLKKYGKGDWRNISRNFVTTRTPTQVASHAQKYFIRQINGGKDKRRSSIHDITTVNVPEASELPDQKRPEMGGTEEDGKVLNRHVLEVSSILQKVEEQSLLAGSVYGSSPLGPYNACLPVQQRWF